MIFTPRHCDLIGLGLKTQTRRQKRGSYKVGGVYAVQPGRGKKAVGYIRIKRIWQQDPWDMTDAEVVAEGFKEHSAFADAFKAAYRRHVLPILVWAFEFEAVAHQEWPR